MILYDYDSNAILAQTIKDRTAPELLKAFQVMEQKLVARGLKPKLVKLDNEASKLLKYYLYQQDITFQLVPPYSHRRNSAERNQIFQRSLNSRSVFNQQIFSNAFAGQNTAPSGHDIKYAEDFKT
jgi:hypothetical protein